MQGVLLGCLKMSTDPKKVNLAKLLAMATKSRTGGRPATATGSQQDQPSVSRYFSPRRTRNQIKIKYEKDAPAIAAKQPVDSVAILAPKRTIKIKSEIVVKIEPVDDSHPAIAVKIEPDDAQPKLELEPLCSSIKHSRKAVKIEPDDSHPKIKPEPHPNSTKRNLSSKSTDESSPSKQPKWEPADWQRTLNDIRTMRGQKLAAVDTMGCHKCADPNADEKTQRFHHLVSLMLSSQTKDEVTFEAMKRLKKAGLTPSSVVAMNVEDLQQLIYPVSFYKNKTKYLQKTARLLIDQYASDIPATYAQMIKLPGIGPKMAHICMYVAWHVVSGIGVDTHVHRITNRLRWTRQPTADPDRTRAALEDWLPMNLWPEVNELLVGFGQTICTPRYPKCGECLLADRCPSRGVKQ